MYINTCGSTLTTAATLTINTPPVITTQPVNTVVCEGNAASLSSPAVGTAITYQWQLSKDIGVSYNNIPGATNATYTVSPTTIAMSAYMYRCIVSGTCLPAAYSNAAVLTVDTIPVVTAQPVNARTCETSNASFSITAVGTGRIYIWQVNTGSGFTNVPAAPPYSGINTSKLTITGATINMSSYTYRCIVTGACPPVATSASASLRVDTIPVVTLQPNNDTVCEGNSATFTIANVGTECTYQWQVDTGVNVFVNINFENYTGEFTPTLTVKHAYRYITGYRYRCVVTGRCAPPATSNPATLTVHIPPHITNQTSSNVTICNTATDSFMVQAVGTSISYQWQLSIDNGTTWLNISGGTTNKLILANVTPTLNNNIYRCIVSGACPPPDTSAPITLTITNKTTWIGSVDTKWSNIANWSCGVLPIASTEVYISSTAKYMPQVDIPTAICDSIFFGYNASLSFTGTNNILEMKGSPICGLCNFDASLGTVIYSKNGPQIILGGTTYNNLEITGSGVKTTTRGHILINSTISLMNGFVVLNDNNYTLGPNASLVGGGSNAYFITSGAGVVNIDNVGVGGKSGEIFVPLSNGTSYTPIRFTNTGSSHNYTTRVYDNINTTYDNWFRPIGSIIDSFAVGRAWVLSTDSAGSNVSITLQWNASDELPQFERQACYMSNYIYPNWGNAQAITHHSITDPETGPYTLTMSGFTQMSVFTVSSSIPGSAFRTNHGTVTVYPNPSNNILNIKFNSTPGRNINIYVLNVYGREVLRKTAVNPYDYEDGIYPLKIQGIDPGEYLLNVEDVNNNGDWRSSRFIKQ